MIPALQTSARRDEGSVSLELAILAPLVTILLMCIVLAGRVQSSRADIEAAARAAARDLSIARDPTAGAAHAEEVAASILNVGSPTCRSMTFTPTIAASNVSVTVACVVDLEAATVLPVPGSVTLTASATEVLDLYRETSP